MNIALSVDWDYFFPNIDEWDYGHKENDFFITDVWNLRASSTRDPMKHLLPKPGYKTFWKRLRQLNIIPPICLVAESHLRGADAVSLLEGKVDTLVVFDQHTDIYPQNLKYRLCQNWLLLLMRRYPTMSVINVLPDFKEGDWIEKVQIAPEFIAEKLSDIAGRLTILQESEFFSMAQKLLGKHPNAMISFICRSGAWTPPWADDAFEEFLSDVEHMDFPEHAPQPREFDREGALRIQKDITRLMPTLKHSNFFGV